MKPLYITKTGNYCQNIEDHLPHLKPTVFSSTGKHVRRVTRFIELALIGAGRAASNLPKSSSVYLSSARGDMGVTIEALNRIYLEQQIPGPRNFINSVSNAACFNIANALELDSASYFITNRYLSLESVLHIACLDLLSGDTDSALVGVVDCVTLPLSEHRIRLSLPADTPLAEGSHWLQLTSNPNSDSIIATLTLPRFFHNHTEIDTWLQTLKLHRENAYFAAGQSLLLEEKERWLDQTGLPPFDYQSHTGHFDSQVGRAFCRFIETQNEGASLLYINRDSENRYVAIQIENIHRT